MWSGCDAGCRQQGADCPFTRRFSVRTDHAPSKHLPGSTGDLDPGVVDQYVQLPVRSGRAPPSVRSGWRSATGWCLASSTAPRPSRCPRPCPPRNLMGRCGRSSAAAELVGRTPALSGPVVGAGAPQRPGACCPQAAPVQARHIGNLARPSGGAAQAARERPATHGRRTCSGPGRSTAVTRCFRRVRPAVRRLCSGLAT